MARTYPGLPLDRGQSVRYFDPPEILGSKEIGTVLFVSGGLLFVYVLLCLRSEFLGKPSQSWIF